MLFVLDPFSPSSRFRTRIYTELLTTSYFVFQIALPLMYLHLFRDHTPTMGFERSPIWPSILKHLLISTIHADIARTSPRLHLAPQSDRDSPPPDDSISSLATRVENARLPRSPGSSVVGIASGLCLGSQCYTAGIDPRSQGRGVLFKAVRSLLLCALPQLRAMGYAQRPNKIRDDFKRTVMTSWKS